jgi:hypothetical protein
VNLDDPEESQESLSNGLHGKRVAAGNEPVNDEGEEYYPSSSPSGPLPWFQQALGINPQSRNDHFRSRAVRQLHPVHPSALLDVGAQSVPNSTSAPLNESEPSPPARNRNNELDEHGKPIERPDAWYRLLTFLFIYCLYIYFWS